jgi:hypothetical protein
MLSREVTFVGHLAYTVVTRYRRTTGSPPGPVPVPVPQPKSSWSRMVQASLPVGQVVLLVINYLHGVSGGGDGEVVWRWVELGS